MSAKGLYGRPSSAGWNEVYLSDGRFVPASAVVLAIAPRDALKVVGNASPALCRRRLMGSFRRMWRPARRASASRISATQSAA